MGLKLRQDLLRLCAFWHPKRYVDFEISIYTIVKNINCDVFPLDIPTKEILNAKNYDSNKCMTLPNLYFITS